MNGDLVVTRHRAYVEIEEAPDRILVSLEVLAAGLDTSFAGIRGGDEIYLISGPGPGWQAGEVAYKIDGWDAEARALTAHKIKDTRT